MRQARTDEEKVARLVAAALRGAPQDAAAGADVPLPGPLYVAFRRRGALKAATWRLEPQLSQALAAAVDELGDKARAGIDCVELCLTDDYRIVDPENLASRFSNRHRGIVGMELHCGERTERHAPTAFIATNRTYARAFELFLTEAGLDAAGFAARGGTIRRFAAEQFVVRLDPAPVATRTYRGNRVVPPEAITAATADDMIATMSTWLSANLWPDGRMTYKYWPSRGEESTRNNTIRQFMATVCLVELARTGGTAIGVDDARRNLDFNLREFYRDEGDYGTIVYDGSAKLGAVALAALAILRLPDHGEFREVFARLCAGIDRLWNPDGSFRTFHMPAGRNDNQNFYPGEALLFWCELYAETRDAALLARIRKSIGYYRAWHMENRNPAFVPWHSQAYVRLLDVADDPALAGFVFEMNDWLLSMQQWDAAPCPDLAGRFYDPHRPWYGPPHASSTGAYLEGLAAAWRLARARGEAERADAYATAIRRGLRSLRQLQFLDETDMFYIAKRERVYGGVRTEAYDNEIRVDNIQHGLMALLAVRRMPEFLFGSSVQMEAGADSASLGAA